MMWTPRPYLSYSAMILLEKNPAKFIQKYVFHEDDYETDAMRRGKRVHEAMENGERPKLFIESSLYNLLPEYQHREYKLEVAGRHCPLLGYLDGFNEEAFEVGDYKIGTTNWTQRSADKLDQFDFYGLMLHIKTGKIPRFFLHHGNPITGEVRTFETKRSLSDILRMSARTGRAWAKIKELCSHYEAPAPTAIT